MKRTLAIALVALTAAAGTASAMTPNAGLVSQVEAGLKSYAVNVDANALTTVQLNQILAVVHSGDSASEVNSQIQSIAR